jgi:hypothetical protein
MKQPNTPSLPTDRAFVIQFGPTEEIAGRVEHVTTGNAGHFHSWQQLQSWIEQMLMSMPAGGQHD